MRSSEEFSLDELEALKTLQAKAKRIQRAKKADERFFRMADERKDELLERWGIPMSVSDQSVWMTDTNEEEDISFI